MARSPRADTALASNGTRRRSRNIWRKYHRRHRPSRRAIRYSATLELNSPAWNTGCPPEPVIGRPFGRPVGGDDSSVVDAEFVIEPAEHRRQHFGQILSDQTWTGLARGLAVHPDANAGRL